jgi:hypothetical protein
MKFVRQKFERNGGFSRTDLVIALAICLLIGLLVLPLLGSHTARNEQASCVNNLRLIGQAFLMWSSESGERNPWMVDVSEGGTVGHPLRQNLWFHYFQLSNYLESPRFLADPGDDRTVPALRPARAWTTSADGGLLNPNYQNNALSYGVGRFAAPVEPTSILGIDRHVRNDGRHADPVFGQVTMITWQTAQWTNAVHRTSGNLLFNDGRVEEADTTRLKTAIVRRSLGHEDFVFPF